MRRVIAWLGLILLGVWGAVQGRALAQTAVPLLPIGAIQGRGPISPYVDQMVTFRGVVTGFYEDRNAAGITYYTLFVQDIPGFEDGDPATSDGIPLFLGRERPSYQPGDQVRVTGRVTEFYGLTELDDSGLKIVPEGQNMPLPAPIFVDPPGPATALAAYFEPLEGMRVAIAGEARVVGPSYRGCGFAVVTESVTAPRLFRRKLEDPIGQVLPILHTSDVSCAGFPVVKNGDRVRGLVGPLIYHFDQFKLVHQDPAVLQVTAVPLPPLPQTPAVAPDQFSVASFNVENYFDTMDDTGSDTEPKPTLEQLEIKQAKLAHALIQVLGCPTVVGIQEVENAGLLSVLAMRVLPQCGFTYQVVHRESVDGRGIDVAYLADPRRVQVQSAELRRGCTSLTTAVSDPDANCAPGQEPLFARPPLEMRVLLDGQPITFLVNHFKSKLGGEAETAGWRMAQAAFISNLVAERLAAEPHAAIIVLGDFNDYELSPPMLAMTGPGKPLTNALMKVPEAQRYSYVYGGVAQMIDGILLSPVLAGQIVTATIMHVNADYPDAWGEDISPERLVYRSTDHDLPLVVLQLPPPGAAFQPLNPTAAQNGRFWQFASIAGVLLLLGVGLLLMRQRK